MSSTQLAIDPEGWIEWKGGEQPVPDGTRVELRFRDPIHPDEVFYADNYDWALDDCGADIAAYRICDGTADADAETDVIEKPSDIQVGGSHYKDMAITPTEYIVANGVGWLEGNAIKYLSRWQNKNGVEDVKKALHYVQLLLERIDND